MKRIFDREFYCSRKRHPLAFSKGNRPNGSGKSGERGKPVPFLFVRRKEEKEKEREREDERKTTSI